jgi:hypothetical protein
MIPDVFSLLLILLLLFTSIVSYPKQERTIHIYVALRYNTYQGIIKVNESLGNGQNPKLNLWGIDVS